MWPSVRDRVLPRFRSAFVRERPGGQLLLLAVVGAVALFVRLHRLGEESVWIDEAISFVRANRTFDALIADSIHRKHLPTYFLVLKAVLPYGDSEAMMRLPSVVFGTVAALFGYALAAVLAGRAAGLAAGLLVATAPIQVHYGQEARMYALLTMATTAAMAGLAWLACHPELAAASPRELREAKAAGAPQAAGTLAARPRHALVAWLAVLLGTALALYTHNTAPLFAATLNVAAAIAWLGMPGRRFGFARNWLLCMAGVVAIWSFWLPTLLRQTATMDTSWHGREATPRWVAGVLEDLYLLGDDRGVLTYLLLALAAFGVYALRRRRHLAPMLLALALVGPLLFYAVSQHVPIFYRRLMIWSVPPWLALCAIGLAGLPRPLAAIAACALLWLGQAQLSAYYAAQTKPAWRPLLRQLTNETDERSVILSARAERFLTYYFQRKSDPLPKRKYKRVKTHPKLKHLKRYVGDAKVFYLVGQTQEEAFRNIRRVIVESGQYRQVRFDRHKNAAVVKYRRRKQPRSGTRARGQPKGAEKGAGLHADRGA